MVLTPVVLSAVAGGVTWWLTSLWSRSRNAARETRRAMLADLASRDGIECEWDDAAGVFRGTAGGRSIEYGVLMSPSIGAVAYVTRAHVQMPVRMFEMVVRPAGLFSAFVGRGATATETGDA